MKNELVLKLTKADIDYKRISISAALYQSNQDFFPKFAFDFILHTDAGIIRTNLRKSTHRIGKGLRPWFRAHSQLKEGAQAEFQKISADTFRLNLI